MEEISLHNKVFKKFLSATEIEALIEKIAMSMEQDLALKTPIFICVLNGAFAFTADLMRKLNFEYQLSFVKLSSYSGHKTTGEVKEILGLDIEVKDRTVVVLDDIVDTGTTMFHFIKDLKSLKPKEIKLATMFYKPKACKYNIKIDYLGLEIGTEFIVGYGLDYNGLGRNYKDLYVLKN